MQKKLTIMIDEEVYRQLYSTIGNRKISKFIESILRPHVLKNDLEDGYKLMSKNKKREEEANDWIEGVFDE